MGGGDVDAVARLIRPCAQWTWTTCRQGGGNGGGTGRERQCCRGLDFNILSALGLAPILLQPLHMLC